MHNVYLLTGSNVGDSLALLNTAIKHINTQVGKVIQQSSIYKTAPWGNVNQQHFYNQVLLVQTTLSAHQVLQTILQIELDMGRVRELKWAPRTIDIDILFYDNLVMDEDDLTVPHPLLHLRKFTLQPMVELAANLVHPKLHATISQLLVSCPDTGLVEKL
jgi:2-amino-4-hydroxy-6-hydroxymethyldihydropteridine diphosphokinase